MNKLKLDKLMHEYAYELNSTEDTLNFLYIMYNEYLKLHNKKGTPCKKQ